MGGAFSSLSSKEMPNSEAFWVPGRRNTAMISECKIDPIQKQSRQNKSYFSLESVENIFLNLSMIFIMRVLSIFGQILPSCLKVCPSTSRILN